MFPENTYSGQCKNCSKDFLGPKRAVYCIPCLQDQIKTLENKLDPKIKDVSEGEFWFVRLPGGSSLSEEQVNEITARTILLRNKWGNDNRYLISDIEFVERFKEAI